MKSKIRNPQTDALSILILEDVPTDAELMERELRNAGIAFTSRRCDTRDAFLKELEDFSPDIVLSDYSMPQFNGLEALELIKERFPSIPLIIVTGSINEETAVLCMKNGAADYVIKENLKRLGSSVGGALGKKQMKEEKEKAEESLIESENRYRMLVETMPDGLSSSDEEGYIIFVNERFCEIVGYRQDELFGHHNFEFLDPDNQKILESQWAKRRAGIEDPYEIRWTKKDGSTVITRMSPKRILDSDGNYIANFAIVTDITDRKRAEEEQIRLKTAIDQAAESIIITDPDGVIQYVNPAFERITGYSREEAIGRNPRILKSGEQDDAFYKAMWDTLTCGKVWKGHFINKRKVGTFYEEDASISPVQDHEGNIMNYVAVKRDVTEEVKLENQLRQAQRMEAIGTLAGGIAHDFNNLLTIIMGNAELGSGNIRPETPLYENLEEIKKAALRAAAMTRQLLAFSRKQVIQPVVLSLNSILEGLEKMLRRMIGEDIDIVMMPTAELRPVKADPGHMEQVVMNLVVNARDAMPRGGRLTIKTANMDLDENYFHDHGVEGNAGPFVMLAVSDNGIGMDAETQSHIFEPFFTTKETGKGTGLGLSTVYGIVKQNGGFVWVDSEPGKGTTFKVLIPRAESDTLPVKKDKSPEASRGGTETILIVEDDDMVRNSVLRILLASGYHVLEAQDGEAALKISNEYEGRIHLLLTDVVMPGMSGRHVAEHFQSWRPEIKILYMSGYTDDTIVQHGVLMKEVEFIQKPISVIDLKRKVREVLDEEIEDHLD